MEIVALDSVDFVSEFLFDQFDVTAVRSEVGRFRCYFQMAATDKIAVDSLLLYATLDEVYGSERGRV